MDILNGKQWHIEHGDCIEGMFTMPDACVDMAVFSPPFPALYAYQSSPADIGNSEDLENEAKLHLSFFYRQLARIIKPGRVIMVHVAQIPRMKRSGEVGLFDFRGLNIRIGQRAGLVYEYDWMLRKNPQSQAIRTKSRELQFSGLESDRAKTRGTLADYLLKFRAPGENAVKICSGCEVSRNDWIGWAESAWWDDIIETDTLNVKEGRGEDDTKHICPLQLEVIRRSILLFSDPGEIVFSPFAGIGSEGFMAVGGRSPKTKKRIDNPRRFFGYELKPEYHAASCVNMARAVKQSADQSRSERMLFTDPVESMQAILGGRMHGGDYGGTNVKQHIANLSGGAASGMALIRVVERFGRDSLSVCFADVGSEEAAVYKFIDEIEAYCGVEVERLNQGVTTWELFESRGMWTSSNGGCVASHHLKKLPLRVHAEQVGTPESSTIYVGFGPDEDDRMERLRKAGAPWQFDFPLTWPPILGRCDVLDELRRRGLHPTDMYERGYPHANCAGACVLAGIGQWRALLVDYPERYAASEAHEQRMMSAMSASGRAVQSILRDRRGGVTRNLPLSQLRREHESGERPADDRWATQSCSCVGNLFD